MTVAPLGSRQAHREASERDKRVRRFLLGLSLANWGIAIAAWMISAYLGITSPARIFVYSVLFVIGLFAVIIALLTYLLEKFGHRPPLPEAAAHEAGEPTADEVGAETLAAETPEAVKAEVGADKVGAETLLAEKPVAEKPEAEKPRP